MSGGHPRVAVAAPNAAAAEAGVRVAAEGGNAVDAAIAATLVTMVNEIGVVSPASGGFVTLQVAGGERGHHRRLGGDARPRPADGPVRPRRLGHHHRLRRRYDDHRRARLRRHTGRDEGARPRPPPLRQGALARGRAARDRGRPQRFPAEPDLRATTSATPTRSSSAGTSRATGVVHDEDGVVIKAGSTVVIPELAEALELIARDGAETMYTGQLAELLIHDMADERRHPHRRGPGGVRGVVRPALVVNQNGWRLATNPPPAVGGVAVAAMLALLDGVPADGSWRQSELERLGRRPVRRTRPAARRARPGGRAQAGRPEAARSGRGRRPPRVDVTEYGDRLGRRRRGRRVRDHGLVRLRVRRDSRLAPASG